MNFHESLAYRLKSGATTAGLAAAAAAMPFVAHAQTVSDGDDASDVTTDGATKLKKIVVEGDSANTNEVSTGISRLPSSVKETPQIINVIPEKVIEQQQATTLEEALRNVPGITMSTGEGRGGQNGSQFRIRGLTSVGDVYTGGLRDFGTYQRDNFNTEGIQVIKGPSGESFGIGNLGGVINQSRKKARLGTSTDVDQSIGTGPQYRTTVDSNIQINDTSALRVNGLFQKGYVPYRDEVKANRYGVALDYGLGLGTDTEWHLGYSYLHNDGTPDYGQPMATGADGISRPLLEYNIPGYDRSTSYVRSNVDKDVTNTHMFDSDFTRELDNGITINNASRVSIYDRTMVPTTPGSVSYTNLQKLLAGTNVALSYGAGGGAAYKQRGWGFQNVLSANGEFNTGQFRHRATVGVDFFYQYDHRNRGTWYNRVNDQMIVDPTHLMDENAYVLFDGAESNATTTDIGLFAGDRMWFNDQFSVQGNVRFDFMRSTFESTSLTGGTAEANTISPSLALIWEPTPDYTFYASYARTYRPIGTDIAQAVALLDSQVPTDGIDQTPERADSYEIGGKINLFDGAVGLTGAIFQIDKKHSYSIDESTGDVSAGFSADGQGVRIRGVEVGVSGELAPGWTTNLSYAYLAGVVTYDAPNNSGETDIGNTPAGVPRHNVSLWTAYEFPEYTLNVPGTFTIGGGFQYASDSWANTGNTAQIPDSFSLDAMVSYKVNRFRVAFNAYNLTDHNNYSSSFNGRAVPSTGRAFKLSIGTTF